MGPKKQYIKQGNRACNLIPFDSSQRASHFSVFVCQNLMKNGHGKRAPKWRWPILGHKMAILATFFEI